MSSLDEKLETQTTRTIGKARATLAQLRLISGFPESINTPDPPDKIQVQAMAETWIWKMAGRPAGEKTIYEKMD